MPDFEKPFRWNLSRRNELGKLIKGQKARTYDAFFDQLLDCCARVVALADNSDLIFIGRSPESIFDHLSGLLFDTSWFDRLELLHFSMRLREESKIQAEQPEAIKAMRSYLTQLKLHPEGIATRRRSVAFVDVVLTGDTFGRLITFLRNWSANIQYDWNAVSRRIRIVGLTERTKTSPKTWRWQQHASWLALISRSSVKNISIPYDLWTYLGDYQAKVEDSHTPERWGDPTIASPARDESQLQALRLAFEVFNLGRLKERREEFGSLLVKQPAMKHNWFRALVQELRS